MRVAVREDRCVHNQCFADHTLDREAAAVDRRLDALDRDPVGRERGRQRGALARGIGASERGRRAPRVEQRIAAGLQRESLQRDRRGGRRLARAVRWRDVREAARHAGQDRRGIDVRRRIEIGIQRDQQGGVVVFERRTAAAQQRRCARARRAQLRDFAALGRDRCRAAPCIRVGDRAGQVEARVVQRGAIACGVRVARHQRQRDAALEAHRHEPAGADRGGGPQRAVVRAGDRLVRRGVPVVGEARAVDRIGKRDRRADAPQQPVFVDEPRRVQIPPAYRREHRIEAGRLELGERVARMGGHAGQHRDVRARAAQCRAPAGPPRGRQVMRRVDQETRRTGIRERGEMRAPPRGQRVVRGVFADLGMRDVHFMGGAARIDQRVVVRALDVPVRMLGAQRVVARDAVRHHFEQHAQPVAVRELREPRERLERAGARRERRRRPVEVGDVAREARDAGGPEAADQHVVEAHAGDVLERVGPCIERADEAGVAEVDVRSEGRCGVHG